MNDSGRYPLKDTLDNAGVPQSGDKSMTDSTSESPSVPVVGGDNCTRLRAENMEGDLLGLEFLSVSESEEEM